MKLDMIAYDIIPLLNNEKFLKMREISKPLDEYILMNLKNRDINISKYFDESKKYKKYVPTRCIKYGDMRISSKINKPTFNWYRYVMTNEISEYELINYMDRITVMDMFHIGKYVKLSERFLRNYGSMIYCWDDILKYQCLSEEFIDEYINRFEFRKIFVYQKVSEKFIEKYKSRIEDWSQIIESQKLSEKFIEDNFIDEEYWETIFIFQILSESFIEKYYKKLWIQYSNKNIEEILLIILRNQKLSEKFIINWLLPQFSNLEDIKKNKEIISNILHYQSLSEYFLEKYVDEKTKDYYVSFRKTNISKKYVEAYITRKNGSIMNSIIRNYQLSEKILEKYIDKIEKQSLFFYQKLSNEFILKHYEDNINHLSLIIIKQEISMHTLIELIKRTSNLNMKPHIKTIKKLVWERQNYTIEEFENIGIFLKL
jgi:hypothetical protein